MSETLPPDDAEFAALQTSLYDRAVAIGDEPLVEEREVSEAIGIGHRELGRIRRRGDGPPHYMLPGAKTARYRMSEVRRWLTSTLIRRAPLVSR